ncbi:MAG TPA: ATP-grasp domain-containing protein [Solirubrobacteraceae bacterium]|nr:ATP-grasp domain-containing protein [Solirubrobacteraceae bacterium]
MVEALAVPGRNPLLAPLRARLAEHEVELVAWDPVSCFPLPDPAAPHADLYLLKGDDPAVLSAAGCLADTGAPCLNSFEATAAAADKARTLARMARAGLPVPASQVIGERDRLAALLEAAPRFVKPIRGAHGDGAERLEAGQAHRAGPPPWLVQEPVEGTGRDLKVYGVGEKLAVRRMRFRAGTVDMPREPAPEHVAELRPLALAAAAAAELDCYGADFLLSPVGPVLVDVNAFPGYRTVDEAPTWLAAAVLRCLDNG